VWRCVSISWLLPATIVLPQLIVFVQSEERRLSSNRTQDTISYKCEPSGYPSEWLRKLYFAFIQLSVFVIPACIMIYCYSRIIHVVWLRAGPEAARNIDEPRVRFVACRRPTREAASGPAVFISEVVSSPDHQRSPHLPRRYSLQMDSQVAVSVPRRLTLTTKRSVTRMAMSVTVGFMVCWTPLCVVISVRIYSDYQYTWTAAKLVSFLMALSHSAVNPFLYIVFFTRAVRAAFSHLCQRAQPRCCCQN